MFGECIRTFIPCQFGDHGNCVGDKMDHQIHEKCDCFCHVNEQLAKDHTGDGAISEYLESL